MLSALHVGQATMQIVLFVLNTVFTIYACVIIIRFRVGHTYRVLTTIVAMNILSIVVFVSTEYSIFFQSEHEMPDGSLASLPRMSVGVMGVAGVSNCLIGDFFVLWRTWNIMSRPRSAVPVFGALLFCSAATGGFLVYSVFECATIHTVMSGRLQVVAMCGFPCVTTVINLTATWLVIRKQRSRRLQAKEFQPIFNDNGVTWTMRILIHTGVFYSGVWAATLVLVLVYSLNHNAHYFAMSSAAQFTMLYPAVVVVLVYRYSNKKNNVRSVSIATAGIPSLQDEPNEGIDGNVGLSPAASPV